MLRLRACANINHLYININKNKYNDIEKNKLYIKHKELFNKEK